MNSGSVTSDIRRLRKTRTYLITYLTYAQWPVRPWSFVETPVTRTVEPDHGKREREDRRVVPSIDYRQYQPQVPAMLVPNYVPIHAEI